MLPIQRNLLASRNKDQCPPWTSCYSLGIMGKQGGQPSTQGCQPLPKYTKDWTWFMTSYSVIVLCYPADGGNIFLRNFGTSLPNNPTKTVMNLRRPLAAAVPLTSFQTSTVRFVANETLIIVLYKLVAIRRAAEWTPKAPTDGGVTNLLLSLSLWSKKTDNKLFYNVTVQVYNLPVKCITFLKSMTVS